MARSFNGTTQYANHGSAASLDSLTDVTVIARLKHNTSTKDQMVVSKTTTSFSVERYYLIIRPTTNYLQIQVSRASTYAEAIASANGLTSGTWYDIASTWSSGSSPRLYTATVGSLLAEVSSYSVQNAGSGSVGNDSAADLTVARITTALADYGLVGDLAMVAIYNRVLSTTEMHAAQRRPEAVSGLVLYTEYGFGDRDWSKEGNHATLNGSPAVAAHPPVRWPLVMDVGDEAYAAVAGGGGAKPWYYYAQMRG